MTKKQHYMTIDERYQLEALREANVPVAQIAKQLGFCRQTIYDEIKRGLCAQIIVKSGYYHDVQRYSANKAQQIHDYNQTAKGRPLKIGNDHAYAAFLEKKMLGVQEDGTTDRRKRYSPAAALAAARKENFKTSVCTSTLYSYIDKGVFLHLTNKDLWEKSKRKKQGYKPVRRIAHPALPSIIDRPETINQREEVGHQEMDLIVSAKNGKCALLVLVDRNARDPMIIKIPDKKAATIRAVLDQLEQTMPDFRERFKTITTDNGSEFLEYDKLVESIHGGKRFDVYYCHSYAAWEKGTCENLNRMIRRWFPKGTNFAKVPVEEIMECQEWLRNYPRKSLDWKTPREAVCVTNKAGAPRG